jgi:hypothetical protein
MGARPLGDAGDAGGAGIALGRLEQRARSPSRLGRRHAAVNPVILGMTPRLAGPEPPWTSPYLMARFAPLDLSTSEWFVEAAGQRRPAWEVVAPAATRVALPAGRAGQNPCLRELGKNEACDVFFRLVADQITRRFDVVTTAEQARNALLPVGQHLLANDTYLEVRDAGAQQGYRLLLHVHALHALLLRSFRSSQWCVLCTGLRECGQYSSLSGQRTPPPAQQLPLTRPCGSDSPAPLSPPTMTGW